MLIYLYYTAGELSASISMISVDTDVHPMHPYLRETLFGRIKRSAQSEYIVVFVISFDKGIASG